MATPGRDRRLVYAAALIRALATGMVAVLLGLYLPLLGCSAVTMGLVVSAGLAGAAVASLVVTLAGDRAGRRRVLVALALLGAGGGTAVALSSHPLALAAAAFLGMVNGMGRDRGASLVVEQALLPATTTAAGRTQAFAWYNVVQDVGHAAGLAAQGTPTGLSERVWYYGRSRVYFLDGHVVNWQAASTDPLSTHGVPGEDSATERGPE